MFKVYWGKEGLRQSFLNRSEYDVYLKKKWIQYI